jgi:hypothetical protein
MAKKTEEQLAAKRLQKLRAAIRNVWQYDFLRKQVVTAATVTLIDGTKMFTCPICGMSKEIDMATVDHEPELGSFDLTTIGDWIVRCFYGPQRAVCKPCHRRKPKGRKGATHVR